MSEWKKVRLGDILLIQKKSKIKASDGIENGIYPFFTCSNDIVRTYNSAQYKGPALIFGTGGKASVHFCDTEFSTSTDCLTYYPVSSEINLDLVNQYIQSNIYLLENGFKGAGLKHVSRDYIANIEINLPDIKTQNCIVQKLNKAKNIISNSKKLLTKYDTLIKSRFIEMFGNPQCISNNWKVNPLSDYCIVNPKKSELGPIPDDYELSFIPMQSVSENGDVDTSSIKHYKDVKTGFTYFRENDVLFAKITPCMENGKGGVARKLKNQIGFGSTEFHVLRPIETISNSEWIYRLTTFKTFRKDAENNMTGSAGQRRTPKEFFDKYKVGLPPIELQNDFAAFVQQIDKSKFEYTYTGVAA